MSPPYLVHIQHGDDDVGDEARVGGNREQELTVLDFVSGVTASQGDIALNRAQFHV